MKTARLLPLILAVSLFCAVGSARAAYDITGMDIYGHGVVTASDLYGPALGSPTAIHIKLSLWPPFVGNPYPAIPDDATGAFQYSTIGGPWGFEVNIRDLEGWAFCESCDADFSLLDGLLTGPFWFDAGVDPVHWVSVHNDSFVGQTMAPDFSPAYYSGSFVLDHVLIHTDAPLPEPAAWVLMIGGFLGAGQMLRGAARRARSRPAAVS
ncbi:MAG: hypothetical protein ACXWKR_01810 [Phenylobacterium sp.]